MLLIVGGPLAIGGAVYVTKLSMAMDGYLVGGHCVATPSPADGIHTSPIYRCALHQLPWQFPVAQVLGLVGLRLTYVALKMAPAAAGRARARRALRPTRGAGRVAVRPFVLAVALRSARQMLAIVIAVLSIGLSAWFGGTPLNNPNHLGPSDRCWPRRASPTGPLTSCTLPSRYAFQTPIAVLLGLVGLGTALVVAGRRRPARDLPGRVRERVALR
ncbi:MAG: hypothetical protein QOG85_1885 [Gaiellaceae bacterium]|jgi:hypothetical protein|nr:hypothetical protein [Gaiellaceae bacterium]